MSVDRKPVQTREPSVISRRDALKLAALGALGLPFPVRGSSGSGAGGGGAAGRPGRIILMVSDGMSLGVPSLAEPFSRMVGKGGTQWAALTSRPDAVKGFFDMASLNSLVTDSAAASSSWGSGSRVDNGALNWLPDGRALKPLAAVAKEAGWRVGLVTTTRITHATPAGFAAAVPNRSMEDEIAVQYLDRVDFLCGGGAKHFEAKSRIDGRDLSGEFGGAGYRTVRDRETLIKAGPGRLLGIFGPEHLPFAMDRLSAPELARAVPTLGEMAGVALRCLAGWGDPFLLQIEGGRVDHAAHANDAAAILHEQLDFDAALGEALRFAETHPDTLLIATTDHGNGNMGLNGIGPSYTATNACFEMLKRARWSSGSMRARCGVSKDKEAVEAVGMVKAILEEGLGFAIRESEAKRVVEAIRMKGGSFDRELSLISGRRTGIGWTGMAHTADWAPILAVGPGADRFGGLIRNTGFFAHASEWMGGGFRNPSLTPEEAMKHRPVPGPLVADGVPGGD